MAPYGRPRTWRCRTLGSTPHRSSTIHGTAHCSDTPARGYARSGRAYGRVLAWSPPTVRYRWRWWPIPSRIGGTVWSGTWLRLALMSFGDFASDRIAAERLLSPLQDLLVLREVDRPGGVDRDTSGNAVP